MTHRVPSWLPLFVASLLALQGVLPVLTAFAPPVALAEGMNPARPAVPRATEIAAPSTQPEQTLAAEPAPAAPIPPSAARLPEGEYAAALPMDGREARFAELPLTLMRATDTTTAPLTARLTVLAPEAAAQLSPAGIAFTLAISQTSAVETPLYLTLDYGQLDLPVYGASFLERLTLYRGFDCQGNGAKLTCRAFVPLPGSNDAVNE